MAKRGETRPWKVRFQWTEESGELGNKGTIACHSEDKANMQADRIRGYGEYRPGTVTVVVTYEPKKVPA